MPHDASSRPHRKSVARRIAVSTLLLPIAFLALSGATAAEEVTVQNDTLVDNSSAAICPCFVTGERAAAWLTSPCDGDVVALQVFWRSFFGGAADSLEAALLVFEAGTFPEPGTLLLNLAGPLLSDDNNFDEFRYTDENNTVPIQVPVAAGETFVFALEMENSNAGTLGPSVVSDANGCKPNRNAIYAQGMMGFEWVDACTAGGGISGDWVLRAVVNCSAAPSIFTDGFESGDVSAWTSSSP